MLEEISQTVELIICRHGETEHNCTNTVQGQSQSQLTDKGIQQARKLRDRFKDSDIDAFYSSSMPRAHNTAEIVAEPHDAEVTYSDKLKEICRADFEGESFEDMLDEIESSEIKDHLWKPEGGENLKELKERASEFLKSLTERHAEDKVLVVSHSGTISASIMGLIDHSARQSWRFKQDNCCVNRISWSEDRGWIISSVNDSCHL